MESSKRVSLTAILLAAAVFALVIAVKLAGDGAGPEAGGSIFIDPAR